MQHVNIIDGLRFDIDALRHGISEILAICDWHPKHYQIGLTHALQADAKAAWHDATGSLIYEWGDNAYDEHGNLRPKTVVRNESDFIHFVPEFNGTVFRQVYDTLSSRFKLGRVRLMMSRPKSCLSWHTDAQPRLHVPIITNPGARLVIEDEAHHLKADGSVYMANTLLHHTAFNSGLEPRIHLVAGVLDHP